MSRIALDRLVSMRRYKMALRDAIGAGGVLDALPGSWLSDRGLTRSDVGEKLDRMFACADRVECSDVGSDENGPVLDVLRANWCKCHSVCSICSARLQGRRRTIYGDSIRAAVREFPHRYMVTFTIKDGADLGGRLDHLRSAFRAWYLMGQVRRDKLTGAISRSRGESGKVCAALAGVELKKTDRGLWHMHIHALIFTADRLDYQVYDPVRRRALEKSLGRRASAADLRSCVSAWGEVDGVAVPVSKLSAEWIAASGDSCNIDVLPLRGGWIQVQAQALEVLKYSSKLAAVSAGGGEISAGRDLIDLVASTYGRRLFMALRGFRGLVKRDGEMNIAGKSEYTIVWDYSGGEYTAVRGSLQALTRKETLSAAGKMVGAWRRDRRDLLVRRDSMPDVAARLDKMKSWYRTVIQSIYRAGVRSELVESCRRLIIPLPPAADPPAWVQGSLFA